MVATAVVEEGPTPDSFDIAVSFLVTLALTLDMALVLSSRLSALGLPEIATLRFLSLWTSLVFVTFSLVSLILDLLGS